jgi:hypothetical protein
MTNQRKAQMVTVVVLVAALAVALGRRPTRAEQSPQDAIYAMLDAARNGDVNKYLASYTGPMEAALRQSLAETTEAGFARYLRESNTAIKGIAVAEPQQIAETETKVRVEYIYQDRNEAQTMYLLKGPKGWKISRADSDERVKTLIPYGTPVR